MLTPSLPPSPPFLNPFLPCLLPRSLPCMLPLARLLGPCFLTRFIPPPSLAPSLSLSSLRPHALSCPVGLMLFVSVPELFAMQRLSRVHFHLLRRHTLASFVDRDLKGCDLFAQRNKEAILCILHVCPYVLSCL